MGCHTWVYAHIPVLQKEWKKLIIEQGIKDHEWLISVYKENQDGEVRYNSFIRECKDFLEEANSEPIDQLSKNYGVSEEEFKEEVEWTKKAVDWTPKEYQEWLISECEKTIESYKKGIIPEYGSVVLNGDEHSNLYEVTPDGKIYINGIVPHGDDLGRIHDYSQPDCHTAEETIECFKSHGEECNEELIRELFGIHHMFIHFG